MRLENSHETAPPCKKCFQLDSVIANDSTLRTLSGSGPGSWFWPHAVAASTEESEEGRRDREANLPQEHLHSSGHTGTRCTLFQLTLKTAYTSLS